MFPHLLMNLWAIDHRHVSSHLIGYGSSNHRLPRARGAIQQNSPGRWDPCRENRVNSLLARVCNSTSWREHRGHLAAKCLSVAWWMAWGCLTHRSFWTARGVWEEARCSLWWHPSGCWAHQSCCMWPLTSWLLHLDPPALLSVWNSLSWSRRASRRCRSSVRHQGELWGLSLSALVRGSSPDRQRCLLTLQEDSGSCRRDYREQGMRRGRGVGWVGVGCWLWDQALQACPVPPRRCYPPRWASWAAGRGRLTWSPSTEVIMNDSSVSAPGFWRRSWSLEGDTVLTSDGFDPEAAWAAKVGQGEDVSWKERGSQLPREKTHQETLTLKRH